MSELSTSTSTTTNTSPSKVTAPELSICFSTFGQPVMLKRWFDAFLNEPEEYRNRCEVVCVDDCGDPAAEVPDLPNVRLYRVTDNLPWNQPGARNLAVQQASSRVVLLCDVDMTIPPGMLRKFVAEAAQHQPKIVIRPHLVHSKSGKKDFSSPNVHLMRKADFLAIGGYSEEYVGYKGYSDVTLLHIIKLLLKPRDSEMLSMVLHHDSDIPDAQVRTLNRGVARNKTVHLKHMDIIRKVGPKAFARANKRIRFQWKQIR